MSRRFGNFKGTVSAILLLSGVWAVGMCLSPNRWEIVPRQVFLSDNKFIGWGSPFEEGCRTVPVVHSFLWPMPSFL
jgi:hypothetical protein